MYVELPDEDPGKAQGLVGKINFSLYGTRDAAANWQKCVAEHLVGIGFQQGRSNPCVFHHEARNVRTLVHGDDYASTGTLEDLKWLQTELETRFDMKTQVVGHSRKEGVVKEARILNRIVRATRDGREYVCDQRHVEIILEQLELKDAKP